MSLFETERVDGQSTAHGWIGTLIGRLAPGAAIGVAQAEIARQLGEEYPDERAGMGEPRGIVVDPVPGYILPATSEAQHARFAASNFLTLVAHSGGDAEAILPLLRDQVQAMDSGLSLSSLLTMREQLRASLMPQRMGALLLTLSGAMALVLAVVGHPSRFPGRDEAAWPLATGRRPGHFLDRIRPGH